MTKERWIKGEEQLNKLNKAAKVFSDDYKKEIKVKDVIEKCNAMCQGYGR